MRLVQKTNLQVQDQRLVRRLAQVTGLLPQRQLIQAVAMCDIIALPFELVPSDVPLSVLEAMALGVPVITTQVACLPELTPKGTGLCPLPGDSTALVDAIDTLAANTELRQRLGRKCREQAAYWGACGKDKEKWDTLVKQQAQSR